MNLGKQELMVQTVEAYPAEWFHMLWFHVQVSLGLVYSYFYFCYFYRDRINGRRRCVERNGEFGFDLHPLFRARVIRGETSSLGQSTRPICKHITWVMVILSYRGWPHRGGEHSWSGDAALNTEEVMLRPR